MNEKNIFSQILFSCRTEKKHFFSAWNLVGFRWWWWWNLGMDQKKKKNTKNQTFFCFGARDIYIVYLNLNINVQI